MMRSFAKRNSMDLPMAMQSSVDGGGRSVQMESPAMRAVRNASFYTKMSYFVLLFCFLLIAWGWRFLLISSVMTTLKCDTKHNYCNLTVKRYGTRQKIKVKVHRQQFVRTNQVEIDRQNRITKFVTADGEPHPDESIEGVASSDSFLSYTLVLKPFVSAMMEHDSPDKESADRAELYGNLRELGWERHSRLGEYQMIMKQWQRHSRKSSKNSFLRLRGFIEGKRTFLNIRERISPSWKGVLSLILGLFGVLLTVLVGQFWEEDKRPFVSRRGSRNQGGPGSRNHHTSSSSGSSGGGGGSTSPYGTNTNNPSLRNASSHYGNVTEVRGQYSTAMKRK